MKRLIVMLVVAAMASTSFAQQFVLTPLGFRDAADTSKNYVVIEKPGIAADVLQKNTISILDKIYNKAEDAIISEPGKITIKTRHPNQINFGRILGTPIAIFWLNYSITIQFKDGKIRVDDPSASLKGDVEPATQKKQVVFYSTQLYRKAVDEQPYYLFSDKGKNMSKYTTDQLEKIFNDLVAQVTTVKAEAADDNW